mmetsp:Transcript_1578/g.4735  ORF Transcript_1578/g.4735 Transcript_1578/m.4735 type:complete len:163 (-) Transcript_1578:30-518(-)
MMAESGAKRGREVVPESEANEESTLAEDVCAQSSCREDSYRRHRHPLQRSNDNSDAIYVTRRVGFRKTAARIEKQMRCLKADQDGNKSLTLRAAGAAINMCVDLALYIQKRMQDRGESVVLAPKTSTIIVTDEYEPQQPGLPWRQEQRLKTALEVRIFVQKL